MKRQALEAIILNNFLAATIKNPEQSEIFLQTPGGTFRAPAPAPQDFFDDFVVLQRATYFCDDPPYATYARVAVDYNHIIGCVLF